MTPCACGIEWRNVLSYVHSQTNPQTCTTFGANRSSHLTASPDIWICDPLKPPPHNAPWGIVEWLVFSLCPFPDESADVNQSWCQSVQPFDSFSRRLNVDSLKLPKCPPLCPEGQFVWRISVTRWICRCVPNLVPIGPAVWQLQQTFEFVTRKPLKCPWDIEGRIVFSLCRFPDESADVYQMWCQSVQPFDSFPILLNLWPPTLPRNAPWGIEGRLGFSLCPFPDESADVNQSWCQSVQPFDSFPDFWMFDHWNPQVPPPPFVARGNLFGVYPFPDGSADVCQIWGQSVQPFDSFPRLLNLWHPLPPPSEMPPGVLRGDLYLAYVHSQMNPQTWTKVGANRTASPDFLIVLPLKPPSAPLVYRGAIFLAYIHSQMNLHMCAKFGANRPSRLEATLIFFNFFTDC